MIERIEFTQKNPGHIVERETINNGDLVLSPRFLYSDTISGYRHRERNRGDQKYELFAGDRSLYERRRNRPRRIRT